MHKRTSSTLREGTIIKHDDWGGWRLVGSCNVWQLQTERETGGWRNFKSFPTLEHALLGAFDYAIINDHASIRSVREAVEVYDKASGGLVEAVRRVFGSTDGERLERPADGASTSE